MNHHIATSFDERGSTLVEALVATLVLATGLLAMAQLVSIATANNLTAQTGTVTTILAEQKLEELRALTWGFDRAGTPVGDAGLQPSPLTALQQNTPGYVDHVDALGAIVGRGAQPPADAVYSRRWSIEPLAANPGDALLIQVLVTRYRNRGRADQGAVERLPGDARLITIKARRRP
jgi:hypothetical protein